MTTPSMDAASSFVVPSMSASPPRIERASSAFAAPLSADRDPIVTWWPARASCSVRPNPSSPVPPITATSIGGAYFRGSNGAPHDRLGSDRGDARAARMVVQRTRRHDAPGLAPGHPDRDPWRRGNRHRPAERRAARRCRGVAGCRSDAGRAPVLRRERVRHDQGQGGRAGALSRHRPPGRRWWPKIRERRRRRIELAVGVACSWPRWGRRQGLGFARRPRARWARRGGASPSSRDRSAPPSSAISERRPILAVDAPQDVGDLAERGPRSQRLLHRRQQVLGPTGRALDGFQAPASPPRRHATPATRAVARPACAHPRPRCPAAPPAAPRRRRTG